MDENEANYLNKMLTQCCINMKYCCFECVNKSSNMVFNMKIAKFIDECCSMLH